MVDFGNIRLPNTNTEGDYLGIEIDFLDVAGTERRPAGIKEEKEPEEPREPAT